MADKEQGFHSVKASTLYKREHKADYGHEKIEILYEDQDIIVINKPSGLLSVPYPGSKARTVLDIIEKIMRGRGDWSKSHRPFTVHRLDRDTSGVMVFALNEASQKKLIAEWHGCHTHKLYRAVAENPRMPYGGLAAGGEGHGGSGHTASSAAGREGRGSSSRMAGSAAGREGRGGSSRMADSAAGREGRGGSGHTAGSAAGREDRGGSSRMAGSAADFPPDPILGNEGTIDEVLAENAYHVAYVPRDGGKSGRQGDKTERNRNLKTVRAVTHYKVIYRGETHTLFELELDTGKKNQIRAHLSFKGYPLAGDENYRAKTDPFHRLALHARKLEFLHPATGKKMSFEVAEDDAWLEYVKKGDRNPPVPVWKNGKREPRREEAMPASVPKQNRRISAKEMAHGSYAALKGRK